MNKRLLVASDLSRNAQFAGKWAARHAASAGHSLVLYHAVTVEGTGHPSFEVRREAIVKELEDAAWTKVRACAAALQAAAPGVDILCDVEVRDDRVDAILGATRRLDAAAIVVGSRGENPLSRAVLGSVATGVLARANCPVVVVPKHARYHGLEQVVLASDLTDLARDLDELDRFVGEARPALRILHLRRADEPAPTHDALTVAAECGWPHATFTASAGDDYAEMIDEVVADVSADLVAMTVQEHGTLYRLFHRDLVHAVAFEGLVPVLGLRG
ncbi:MAG TPA: universal stress protein [Casimicrobiaceae bacterium]|nr:universal stress protein [Casimicrobiaceae bacterium]